MAEVNNHSSVIQYCVKSMAPQLDMLNTSMNHLQKRKNIEDIHDLRVASRRLRTILTIFQEYLPSKKSKPWLSAMKDITSSFGSVRDLDVQIDLLDTLYQSVSDARIQSGLKRIRLRLNQRRDKKQPKMDNLIKNILESSTSIEMRSWAESVLESTSDNPNHSRELFQLGYRQIQSKLDELLFLEVYIFDPNRIKELHQMRIAAKRLRYTLEVFSDLYEGKTDFAMDIARQIQQNLGQIHDADVWLIYLPVFLEKERQSILNFYGYSRPFSRLKPGVEFLINNRKIEREKLYHQFIEQWKVWKLAETWLNLRKIIFLTNLEEQNVETDINSDSNTSHIPQNINLDTNT